MTYPTGRVDSYTYSGPFLTSSTPAGQNTTYYTYQKYAQPDSIYAVGQAKQKFFVSGASMRGHIDSVQVAGGANAGGSTVHYYPATSGKNEGLDLMAIDAMGNITTYRYDTAATGNRNRVADSLSGRFTSTTFDGYGRTSTVVVSAPAGTTTITTTYYDSLNRVDSVDDHVHASKSHFHYDSLYLSSITDPRGQQYGYAYNALGWIVAQTDPTARTAYTTYNQQGLPASVTNRSGKLASYTYDAVGRPLITTRPSAFPGDSGTADTLSYSNGGDTVTAANSISTDVLYYSTANGWADSTVSTFGGKKFKRFYGHDALGRIDSVSITTTTSGGFDPFTRYYYYDSTYGYLDSLKLGPKKITFAYNANYQPTSITYPDGVVRSDTYTSTLATGLTSWANLTIPSSSTTTLYRGYGYDSTGRMTEQDINATIQNDTALLYTYSSSGQLVQWQSGYWKTTINTCNNHLLGYGCIPGQSSNLTMLQQDSAIWDAAGNLDSIKAGPVDTVGQTVSGSNRISSWTGLTFGTDSDGNRTSAMAGSTTTNYVWSADGLLRQVSRNDTTRTYYYNALGQLVRRSEGTSVDQYYLWDGGQLLAILSGNANNRVAEFAYFGTDQPIARITGNNGSDTVHYYAQDAAGNVFTQWNGPLATVEQQFMYDPWGAATSLSTTTKDTSQLRWKGLLFENGMTSLYYMRARWYDPVTRRFISSDPLGLSAGINQYAFAGGDPINGADPSGLDSCALLSDGDCEGGSLGGGGGANPCPNCIEFILPPNAVAQLPWWWSTYFNNGIPPSGAIPPQGTVPGIGATGGGGAATQAQRVPHTYPACAGAIAGLAGASFETFAFAAAFATGFGEAGLVGALIAGGAQTAGISEASGATAVITGVINRYGAGAAGYLFGQAAKVGSVAPGTPLINGKDLLRSLVPGVNVIYALKDMKESCF